MSGHDHGGGHAGHAHAAPADFGRAFALGIGLNLVYVAVEAGVGLAIGSMALVADAGHNLSDVAGLALAWGGAALARRRPTRRFTYGLKGASVLAALANAVLLLVACGAIIVEALRRFSEPAPPPGVTVMMVAGVGILINGFTAWLFMRGRKGDINVRGAFLHMAADAGVSAAVVVAGLAMLLTGAAWIDPAVSLGVVAVVLWGTWGLLKDSVAMSLAAVPPGINAAEIEAALAALPGVAAVHDLHVWPMGTTETALTAHLVVPAGHPGDGFLAQTAGLLEQRFGIAHATLQVEADPVACRLAPDDVV